MRDKVFVVNARVLNERPKLIAIFNNADNAMRFVEETKGDYPPDTLYIEMVSTGDSKYEE